MEYKNFFFKSCVLTVFFAISCARSTKGAMKTALDTTALDPAEILEITETGRYTYSPALKNFDMSDPLACMDWVQANNDCNKDYAISFKNSTGECRCLKIGYLSLTFDSIHWDMWRYKADSTVCDTVAGGGCAANARCASPGSCKCLGAFQGDTGTEVGTHYGDGTLGGTGCIEMPIFEVQAATYETGKQTTYGLMNPFECMEWAQSNDLCRNDLGASFKKLLGDCTCATSDFSTISASSNWGLWIYKANSTVCDTVAGGGCATNARCAYPGSCKCLGAFQSGTEVGTHYGDGTLGGTGCIEMPIFEVQGGVFMSYRQIAYGVGNPFECMEWAQSNDLCRKDLGVTFKKTDGQCMCATSDLSQINPSSNWGLWIYKPDSEVCGSVAGGGCAVNASCAYPGHCKCQDGYYGDGTLGGEGCKVWPIEITDDHVNKVTMSNIQRALFSLMIDSPLVCMEWAQSDSRCNKALPISYRKDTGECRCQTSWYQGVLNPSSYWDTWSYKADSQVCDSVGGCVEGAKCLYPGQCGCPDGFLGDGSLGGSGCTEMQIEISAAGKYVEQYAHTIYGMANAQECMDWAQNHSSCVKTKPISFAASRNGYCLCSNIVQGVVQSNADFDMWSYKADSSVCDPVAGGGCEEENGKCMAPETCGCPELYYGDGTKGGTGCKEFKIEVSAAGKYVEQYAHSIYGMANAQECMDWAQNHSSCVKTKPISFAASRNGYCLCSDIVQGVVQSNTDFDMWVLKPSSCNDNKQYGDETGVDCGGSCPKACATCSDGIRNRDETGVDCGGKHCDECRKLKRPNPVYCKENEKVQGKKCVPCEAGWTNPAGDDLWGRNSFCRGKNALREGKKLRVRMDGNLTALSDDKQQELKNTLAAKLGVGAEQITLISGSIIVEVAYDTEEEAQAATDSSDVLNEIESSVTAVVDDNAVQEEEAANVYGDPHFVGFDGSRYDFRGSSGSIFNIITDEQFQLNARFVESPTDERTYMGVIGLRSGADQILITPDVVLLNNDPVPKGGHVSLHGKKDEEGLLILTDGRVRVKSSDFQVDVKVAQANGFAYLNIESASAVSDHLVHPHGILGQTAQYMVKGTNPEPVRLSHKNLNAQGFLDGVPSDYVVTDGLMGTTFTFNRYGVKKERNVGAVRRRFSFGRATYLGEERS